MIMNDFSNTVGSVTLDPKGNMPLVAIQCLTFNQVAYIRQTLEGIVSQDTKFRYVAVVHDDASTDGTSDIVREYAEKYPEVIIPILEKQNQYSKRDGSLGKIMRDALYRTGEKYIAFCEGDDYWTDPLKLQKQVDVLEADQRYGMCCTHASMYIQSEKRLVDGVGTPKVSFLQLLDFNTVVTLTVVLRTDLLKDYISEIKPQDHGWLMGDYPLWLYIAAVSIIKYLPDNTGVYRISNGSESHTDNMDVKYRFKTSVYDIRKFFARRYTNLYYWYCFRDFLWRWKWRWKYNYRSQK